VERGEEIVIPRHDKPVARLVPNAGRRDQSQAHAASQRIRARAQRLKPAKFDRAEVLDSSVPRLDLSRRDQPAGQQVLDFVWPRTARGFGASGSCRLENILEMSVRRGRHNADFRDKTLAELALLPIRVDPETDRQAWSATARSATRRRLTLYDAAYLELALRRNLRMATLDHGLRAAAKVEKVKLLGASK
jgi:antitoxin (DNA-binding transcriptional repressor) of toxin-antitoxin stability system